MRNYNRWQTQLSITLHAFYLLKNTAIIVFKAQQCIQGFRRRHRILYPVYRVYGVGPYVRPS